MAETTTVADAQKTIRDLLAKAEAEADRLDAEIDEAEKVLDAKREIVRAGRAALIPLRRALGLNADGQPRKPRQASQDAPKPAPAPSTSTVAAEAATGAPEAAGGATGERGEKP